MSALILPGLDFMAPSSKRARGLTSQHIRSAIRQGVATRRSAIPRTFVPSPAVHQAQPTNTVVQHMYTNMECTAMDTSPGIGGTQFSIFSQNVEMDTVSSFGYEQFSIFSEPMETNMDTSPANDRGQFSIISQNSTSKATFDHLATLFGQIYK